MLNFQEAVSGKVESNNFAAVSVTEIQTVLHGHNSKATTDSNGNFPEAI